MRRLVRTSSEPPRRSEVTAALRELAELLERAAVDPDARGAALYLFRRDPADCLRVSIALPPRAMAEALELVAEDVRTRIRARRMGALR